MKASHLHTVTGWIADLANLTAGNQPLADAKTKIAGMASVIAEAFPDPRTFSRRSLEEIAAQNTFFPAYGQLKAQLERWWNQNRPAAGPALTAPDENGLEAADRSMLVFWGEYTSGAKVLPEGVTLTGWLSMCRAHRPKAFAQLVRTDPKAADIAVRKRWHIPESGPRHVPTPEEEEAVHQTAQEAVRAIAQAVRPDPVPRATYAAIDAAREQSYAAAERLRAQQARVPVQPLDDALIKARRDADPMVQAARAAREMIDAERAALAGEAQPSPPAPHVAERERQAFPWNDIPKGSA